MHFKYLRMKRKSAFGVLTIQRTALRMYRAKHLWELWAKSEFKHLRSELDKDTNKRKINA